MPCVPTDVVMEIDCANNRAVVSWSASDGALSYKVTAQSLQGATSLCESAGLTCTLTNLTCGQSYSVQVVAEDDICSSLPSQATTFHSGKSTQPISVVLQSDATSSNCQRWGVTLTVQNIFSTERNNFLLFTSFAHSSVHTKHWHWSFGLFYQLSPAGLDVF